ncbi:MAG TPA: cupredoxin domain-containing protein [Vicinamibacterales bacterium]|nr:cupredoxin domain-containing protein [Vicinamibacterales bacterium]
MHTGFVPRPRPLWLPVLLAGFALLPAARPAGPDGPAVREFTVEAERFEFTPDRIEVNQGDTVRVTVQSTDVTHGFEIEEFDIDLYVHKSGRPATAEFVADRAGSFEITCSEYCGRGHSRMKGVLIVNPGGKS